MMHNVFVKVIEAQSFEEIVEPLTDNQPMVRGIGSRDDEVPGPSSQADDGWLVVLRLNVPVNNFSVMSGRSHRFLGN